MSYYNHLGSFLATYRLGAIREASELLNITSAAISKHIKILEHKLKRDLFLRQGKNLIPTPFAHELAANVAVGIDTLDSILEPHKLIHGTVRISVYPFFYTYFIAPLLQDFMAQYPDVKLEIRYIDGPQNITVNDTDLLFGIARPLSDNWTQKELSVKSSCILCATPGYLEAHGTPTTPEELKTHRFIGNSSRIKTNTIMLKDDESVLLSPIFLSSDASIMADAALRGLGIVYVRKFFVDKHLKSGALIEVMEPYRPPEESLFIYYPHNRYMNNAVQSTLKYFYNAIQTRYDDGTSFEDPTFILPT